jgi:DNA polymerase-3 subunit delta'
MKLIKKYIYQNQNNYNLILKKMDGRIRQEETHNNFVDWIRLCFLSKNKKSIPDLINWCEDMGRSEKGFQLQFLKESSQILRHAFLLNYNPSFTLSPEIHHPNFNINNFSNHLSNNNIYKICTLLDSSHDYLNRYANSKILFLDLSFSLGKLLHKQS